MSALSGYIDGSCKYNFSIRAANGNFLRNALIARPSMSTSLDRYRDSNSIKNARPHNSRCST